MVPCEFNEEDVQLLARITHAEAEGKPGGKTAVAATVLNRVKNENYPDSIAGVVYQRVNGIYQYSPVADGRINLQPGQESKRAAYLALAGEDPTKEPPAFTIPGKPGTDGYGNIQSPPQSVDTSSSGTSAVPGAFLP